MNVLQAVFQVSPRIFSGASAIRGFFAAQAPDNPLLHHHEGDDHFLYFYPRIQYKVIDGKAVIVGIEEGVPTVKEITSNLQEMSLNGTSHRVIQSRINQSETIFGLEHAELSYSFLTPWLALNEENYERYKTSAPTEQRDLLRRILIGNILSMSKGLGYVVTEEIKVSQLDVYPVKTPVRLKGVGMTGFKGSFSVNFELPDYIALGKSVSRGFGTIKRVEELRSGEFGQETLSLRKDRNC